MRSRIKLVLPLVRTPGFCCCCICLRKPDAERMRRIFRIVRKATRER